MTDNNKEADSLDGFWLIGIIGAVLFGWYAVLMILPILIFLAVIVGIGLAVLWAFGAVGAAVVDYVESKDDDVSPP